MCLVCDDEQLSPRLCKWSVRVIIFIVVLYDWQLLLLCVLLCCSAPSDDVSDLTLKDLAKSKVWHGLISDVDDDFWHWSRSLFATLRSHGWAR